jgi:hypothetical protein
MALMMSDLRHWLVSPGPISPEHAAFGQDCAQCHSAADGGAASWVKLPHPGIADSNKCVQCHELGGETANDHQFAAHSISPGVLAEITRRTVESGIVDHPPLPLAMLPRSATDHHHVDGRLTCATCHHEHRGPDFDAGSMGNQQCQVCHASQFASLASGHPEFRSYPRHDNTGINFDHKTHHEKHFLGTKRDRAPGACTDCHASDVAQKSMTVKSFDTMCAACHTDDINVENDSFTFLSLPALDTFTLDATTLGKWPTNADSNGAMTPLMKALLAADPQTRTDLHSLASVDLTELPNDPATLAAVNRVIWQIKDLAIDLRDRGTQTLFDRMRKSVDENMSDADIRLLVDRFDLRIALRAAVDDWFPSLTIEIAKHRAGMPLVEENQGTANIHTEKDDDSLEDLEDDDDSLEDLEDDDDSLEDLEDDDDSLEDLEDDDDSLEDLEDDDDSLEDLEDDDDSLEDLEDDDDSLEDLEDDDDSLEDLEDDVENYEKHEIVEPGPVEQPSTGWYYKRHAIVYRPDGHADPYLRNLLELQLRLSANPGKNVAFDLLKGLSDPTSGVGSCMKCHAPAPGRAGQAAAVWRAAFRPAGKAFTKFSHGPHLTLAGKNAACQSCHQLPESHPGAGASGVGNSDFTSIRKASCASCHVAEKAGDRCLDCHNYHVDLTK